MDKLGSQKTRGKPKNQTLKRQNGQRTKHPSLSTPPTGHIQQASIKQRLSRLPKLDKEYKSSVGIAFIFNAEKPQWSGAIWVWGPFKIINKIVKKILNEIKFILSLVGL